MSEASEWLDRPLFVMARVAGETSPAVLADVVVACERAAAGEASLAALRADAYAAIVER